MVNDIIAISIIIAGIKLLKFTSLKIAIITFIATISIEMIFVFIIHFVFKTPYSSLVLNTFNVPLQLQVPTINAVYNQKCAWLSINSIIYPGMLMYYVRRFDTSRNTNVYLITCTGLFIAGSFSWIFINAVSPNSFPLGIITQPAMIGLVCIFAYKRR